MAFGTLTFTSWTYATQSLFLYDYFFGQYGITSALSQTDTSVFDMVFFDQIYTYYIIMTFIAVLVGFLVFIVLQNVTAAFRGAKSAVNDIESTEGHSRHAVETELIIRMLIRIIGLSVWTAYWIFFLGVLLPFCVVVARTGAGTLNSWEGYGMFGFSLALLWLGLHIHIVCLRLVILRPRLFGGKNTIEAELYAHK